ncbi:sigma-70 family RNA polymerase sigma factor [Novipirellula herctigrandis]
MQESGSSSNEDVTRFVKLLTANEGRLRAFLFSLVVNRDTVDELMQEISIVLWKKFAQLEDDEGFLKWAYVVARFEVLMFRRQQARDRLVFDENVLSQLADEYSKHLPDQDGDERRQCLIGCLKSLDESEHHLLMTAYGHGTHIKALAERLELSANSLYKTLGRLRRRLKYCVDSKLSTS